MSKMKGAGLILFGLLLFSGCGGGGGDGADMGGECITISGNGTNGTASVSITGPLNACDNAYSPPILIVQVNGTVTWTNTDNTQHTVTSSNGCACSTSDAILPEADRELDSLPISPGGTYPHTFNFPGTYDYVCIIDNHMMRGRVIVQ